MAKAAKKKKPVKKKAAKKKKPTRQRKTKVKAQSPSEPKPTGRPEIYTPEIANLICAEIANSTKSLRTICKPDDMPCVQTVLKWLREDTDGFLAQYTRAKEEQADFMVEEMIEIADDGTNDLMTITKGDISYDIENKEVTSRSKLRVETRKWAASKLKPKRYGDKLDLGFRGKDGELVNPPALNITVAPIDIPIAEKEE
jgi:hypothetical protein